jgi:hypothetical protein
MIAAAKQEKTRPKRAKATWSISLRLVDFMVAAVLVTKKIVRVLVWPHAAAILVTALVPLPVESSLVLRIPPW